MRRLAYFLHFAKLSAIALTFFRYGWERTLLSARGRVPNLPLLPLKPVMPSGTPTPFSLLIQENQ
jgi:hypothetical protein